MILYLPYVFWQKAETVTDRVDPDQMPQKAMSDQSTVFAMHNVASDQELHCVSLIQQLF